MRRLIKVNASKLTNAPVTFVYYATGAKLVSQYRYAGEAYETAAGLTQAATQCPVVYADAIFMNVPVTIAINRYYCFVVDVDENQPNGESVEVTTSSANNITVKVYNENGVLVCSAVSSSTGQSTESTTAPGEMTSVPGEEPGEMRGETIDEPDAMN